MIFRVLVFLLTGSVANAGALEHSQAQFQAANSLFNLCKIESEMLHARIAELEKLCGDACKPKEPVKETK